MNLRIKLPPEGVNLPEATLAGIQTNREMATALDDADQERRAQLAALAGVDPFTLRDDAVPGLIRLIDDTNKAGLHLAASRVFHLRSIGQICQLIVTDAHIESTDAGAAAEYRDSAVSLMREASAELAIGRRNFADMLNQRVLRTESEKKA